MVDLMYSMERNSMMFLNMGEDFDYDRFQMDKYSISCDWQLPVSEKCSERFVACFDFD
jgi:hypothetical protein